LPVRVIQWRRWRVSSLEPWQFADRCTRTARANFYGLALEDAGGFSGDGGPATSAALSAPEAAITGPAGDVLISDTGNYRVREVAG
jgi:hypothetical protein